MKKSRFDGGRWHKVEVHWRDSMSYKPIWQDPGEFCVDEVGDDGHVMVSRGFAYAEDRHYLYLALSVHFHQGCVQAFGDTMRIPKGSIIKTYYGKRA